MKQTQLIFFIFFAFLFFSCQPEVKTASAAATVDSKIFEEIMAGSAAAWNNGDLDGHLAIYDSSATFMSAKGLITVAALKENFQKKFFNGSKPVQQLGFSEIQVRPLGNEFALITGKFILSGGGKPEQSGRYSLVFGKTKSGWKVLHDHSS